MSDEEAKAAQHEVQRLLGRCLLRLQQYEGQLKAIIAGHHISGNLRDLQAEQEKRAESISRKTLGILVGELMGTFLVEGVEDDPPEAADDDRDQAAEFRLRIRLGLPKDVLEQTKSDLGNLVITRNELVHHFVETHDLCSLDGCKRAKDALIAAYEQTDQCFRRLQDWARDVDSARQAVAERVQTEEFRDQLIKAPPRTTGKPRS